MGEHGIFVMLSLLVAVVVLVGLGLDTWRLRLRARSLLKALSSDKQGTVRSKVTVTQMNHAAGDQQ